MKRLVAVLWTIVLTACASPAPPPTPAVEALFSGGRAPPDQLERLIAEAARHPLGSRDNPVRVDMPMGQRAYLARLRCSSGVAPAFSRIGSFGRGFFGSIVDGYQVSCPSGEPRECVIYMDMYHPEHEENAAPPGFTLAPRNGSTARISGMSAPA